MQDKAYSLLEEKYISETGGVENTKLLTDVLPRGITILYGRSGCGKTKSLIKHLNRFDIEPIFLDFDNNGSFKDEFKYRHFNGEWYFKARAKALKNTPVAYLDNMMKQHSGKYVIPKKDIHQEHKEFMATDYGEFEELVYPLLEDSLKKQWDLAVKAYSSVDENPVNIIKGNVFIIDTYVKAMEYFIEVEKLKAYTDEIKRMGGSVVIISHETGERGADTGVDEIFVNHADGRLRLLKDILKSKKTEIYLKVEKLRGYKGEDIIWDWER